ncbi:MAG: GNAT family N-acetyltransferase [Lachnospiraceae bacterium]|nr:GNAT family N-acetyltransferase [Lachnospiraceae bacterium]
MNTKVYTDGLPLDAEKIRKEVFVEEQGFQNEFDETDTTATHIVLYNEDDVPIATCRVFRDDKREAYTIGRLAVVKKYREKNLGTDVVESAEKYIRKQGGHSAILHAQCRVSNFYQKLGYAPYGDVEDDEGCPHIWMRKQL